MAPDSPTILLIEDDMRLAGLIQEYLNQQGMSVVLEGRGDRAVARFKDINPDLLILDLSLPGKDGLDICREIRTSSSIPILILTARDNDTDEILGLEIGADDYVTKPVEPRVLFARIRALLRRVPQESKDEEENEIIEKLSFGCLTVDNSSRTVLLEGKEVTLTTADFEVLWALVSEAGNIVTREDIFAKVRGKNYDGFDRSIDVRISRLRKSLKDHPTKPFRIKTVWGKGYLFVKDAWQ